MSAILATLVAGLVVLVGPAAAVQYGQPDRSGHPYVGLVVVYDAGDAPLWRCSGTLIAPTVLLTAGHCTFGTASARVWFDAEVTAATGYPFSGGVTGTPQSHPDFDDFASFPNTRDLGVVVLNSAVTGKGYGALPSGGYLDDLATRRGVQDRTFTVVGYGLQSVKPVLSQQRTQMVGTVSLVNLRSALTDGFNVQTTDSPGQGHGSGGTCFGDSGGPLFAGATSRVVAVASFGLNTNCKGSSFFYRVDTEPARSFLDDYVTLP